MNLERPRSSGISGAGLKRCRMSSTLGETLEVCIHQILYIRHVYPRDLFAPTRYLDIRVHSCRHPEVVSYISDFLIVASPAICSGEADMICLNLINGYTEEVFERFCFDMSIDKLPSLPDGECEETQFVRDMEWAVRQMVLKVITLEGIISNKSSIQKLPESVTFKLCLRIHSTTARIDDRTMAVSEDLHQALNQGKWFQPDLDSCILKDSHALPSQDNDSSSLVLSRPIKTVHVPSCGFKMTVFMEIKKENPAILEQIGT